MDHERTTIDQFTRQAAGFSSATSTNDDRAMQALLDAARLSGNEAVLDVACGPGIVAAAFAVRARRVVGIDLTPRMLELARERCRERGLGNARFDHGEVSTLPYSDGEFERVVCRYSLHHLADPAGAVAEMARVCAPGGRVIVADITAADDAACADRFDRSERARDPSHCRAMPESELLGLLRGAGLQSQRVASYELPMELESLLARSASPDPDAVRSIFEAAIAEQEALGLGLGERYVDGSIRFEFGVAIVTGDRD